MNAALAGCLNKNTKAQSLGATHTHVSGLARKVVSRSPSARLLSCFACLSLDWMKMRSVIGERLRIVLYNSDNERMQL